MPAKEQSTVIPFKGARGGRPRLDGLTPGSAEAIEADRRKKRDAEQLRRDRERAAREQINNPPPPLPSVVGADVPQPLAGPQAPGEGVAGVPVPAPVGWSAIEAQPLVVNGIPVVQHLCTAPMLKRLKEAGADASLISRVKSDIAWPTEAVTALQRSAPGTVAKILNSAGVPTAFKDELASLPAVALLVQHHLACSERLDTIIAELKGTKDEPKKVEEKKP